MSIITVAALVLISFFVVVPTQMPTVSAYVTPGTGVVWNMNDLVAAAGGDVQSLGGGSYLVLADLTITGGLTPDTVFMRNGETVYVNPGLTITVEGIFLSQVPGAWVEFQSALAVQQPGDWTGFVFATGSVGRFEKTRIYHATRGLEINDADVTLDQVTIEQCHPYGIYYTGGLLHIDRTSIIGSAPPPAAISPIGGTAIHATGIIVDTLWINRSIITGGDGAPANPGGPAIFTLNLDGPIGVIGNNLIQGGNGGYNNVDGGGAGGGAIAFHAFPVWDMGPQPSINISGNLMIRGGNGGMNNASLDGSSGWGGQGIIISDNDYAGSVRIANNDYISGGDAGNNSANWGVGFMVGNGGPGIVLDNVDGSPSVIRDNLAVYGGHGGNNSGAVIVGGATAGWGGNGINLNDVRNMVVEGNTIMGGHGGNNNLTGVGVIAGTGGNGLYSFLAQNLTVRGCSIYGGDGGDDYAGMGPGMMSGPGNGGDAIRSTDNLGSFANCYVEGGKGGDNYGQMGQARPGGYGVNQDGSSSPSYDLGTFVGGRGGDNYNDTGISAGQGNYAFYIIGSQRVNVRNSDIYGGDGGDCVAGANCIPGNGMTAIIVIGTAFTVNIYSNTMITVGLGGTNFVIGGTGAKGSFGVEVGLEPTFVSITDNYIFNASWAGVYSMAPGVLIDGNTMEFNNMGIYLEPTANWANITNNPMIGNGFAGINTVQSDNLLIRNNLIDNVDVGLGIAGSRDVLIDRTRVNNAASWAMRFQTYADRILVENSTITNSGTFDFSVSLWSNATTLNTTFDGGAVDIQPDCNLTVKNYLHTKVLDQTLTPIPNADIEVLDNGAQIYATPGYGGVNSTTDPAGEVNWIVVTDRIYVGDSLATENITDAEVSEGARTFINNPRGVDMYSSHQEVFVEFGADLQPPLILAVLLNAFKFVDVPAGTPVVVTATLNDMPMGGSNITSANYTVGAGNWTGATPMIPDLPPFDFPIEDVTETIVTTGWAPGSYEIWVYGCDEKINCNITGDFATLNITAAIDNVPPQIQDVLVNGLSSVNVVAGTPVDITAVVNDTMTGGSDILYGNYTVGQDNWPGILMNPTDGFYDEPAEDVDEVIDTTGWALAPYEIWVYGCDVIPNCNLTGSFAIINIVPETTPPEIHSVSVNGMPVVSVPAGAIVTLNATVDDTATGGSPISGANYTTGMANWPGVGMSAEDGTWDEVVENVTAQVDTAGWNCGLFDLYVYGWDSIPNFNTTSTAFATINISVCDFEPPEVKQVWIDGSPSQTYYLSVLPASFWLTGVIDDTSTGDTAIGGANYTSPAAAWPGTPMNATDGGFDTSWEEVELAIAMPTAPSTYDYCVYGWDQVVPPNYNSTGGCASLTIIDDIEPNIWNVSLNGASTVSVMAGTFVDLDADIDDSVTGGANIWDANWTVYPPVWPGAPMSATDGAFDETIEGVQAVIDTTGWPVGDYKICVNARDILDNRNITCQNNATLSIVIIDNIPPEISNVLIDGVTNRTTTAGMVLVVNATIDDSSTGGSDIAFANYTVFAQSWPGTPMNGVFDSPTEEVLALIDTDGWGIGFYDIYVYGGDVAYNNNTTSIAFARITIMAETFPPTVTGLPTGTAVSISTNITFEFNEPMDNASVQASFSYTDLTTTWGAADGAFTWSNGDRDLLFDPNTNLSYNTTYIVTLDGSMAVDAVGNPLDGNGDGNGGDDYVFAFKTEDEPPVVDATPPTVVGTTPNDSDTDVSVDLPVIEIDFDEPMKEDLVDVTLDGISTQQSWDGNTLIITPLEDLDYGTTYTVTVLDAEDLAGNPLGSFDFSFATETAPDTEPEPEEADVTLYWLLILILVIVIIILSILLLRKKKPKEEGFAPLEEEELRFEEEEGAPEIDELAFEEEELSEESEFLEDAEG